MFKNIFGLVSLLCISLPSGVFAEGSSEIPNQALASAVVVFEIVDFTSETFVWTGQGAIQVTSPAGTVTALPSGQVFTPTQNGDFSITLTNRSTFDFSVKDAVGSEIPGRVSSTLWNLSQGDETSQNLNGSFFAAIPSGIHTAVIELKLEGFNGIGYSITGNGIGVNGVNAGRSVPTSGNTVTPEYRMYLNPPDQASYSAIVPNTSNFKFSPTGATQDCSITQAGASSGVFTFTSDAVGTYHLICDLNNDGAFSLNDGNDLFLIGATSIGVNSVNWDGTNSGNSGSPIPVGSYSCELEVATGEFHFAVGDAEYSFQGLRLFEVSNVGVKTGLPMYWNDGLLLPRNSDPTLDDGSNTVDFSPLGGLLPGNYDDPAIAYTSFNPDGTGRAWGHSEDGSVTNGTNNTKGNSAFLDTFTWVEESISLNVAISVIDPTLDTDLDGLTDYDEACLTGTDPTVRDSDADGIEDFAEIVSNGGSALAPSDSDGDGVIDALEVCADGHLSIPPNEACDDGNAIDGDGCSSTCTLEGGFDCPTPGSLCTDVDECADSTLNFCDAIATCSNNPGSFTCACPSGYIDANGDGTVCLEIDECAEGTDNCGADAACTNAPGTFICKCNLGYSGNGVDCTISDTDHDGISDLEECTNLAGAPDSCEDSDGDSIVDYLDLDSDNDGILDSVECITQPCENTDSNGGADYIDLDSDGDGITDAFEAGYADANGDGRPDNFMDNDGDGVSDLEAIEPTDSDDDGTPDFQAFDSDNDGIDDSKEGQDSTNDGNPNVAPVGVDTDGDGIDDAFDPDC